MKIMMVLQPLLPKLCFLILWSLIECHPGSSNWLSDVSNISFFPLPDVSNILPRRDVFVKDHARFPGCSCLSQFSFIQLALAFP